MITLAATRLTLSFVGVLNTGNVADDTFAAPVGAPV